MAVVTVNDDLISRQAAINNLARIAKNCARSDSQMALMGRCIYMIENMSSIQPEQKTGQWKNDEHSTPRCSECSYIPEFNHYLDDYYYSDFCPNCGAKMGGEDESNG